MEPYILYPDITREKICFVSEDDLFVGNTDGKNLKRIASGIGVISTPRFSGDGKHIAFRLMRGVHNGVNEIFVCDAEGGSTAQLTHIGSPATGIAGWIDEENIMVYTDIYEPARGLTEFYSVNLKTGKMKNAEFGYGHTIQFSEMGTLLGRNTLEVPYWKNYKGGTRGKVWFRFKNKKKFEKLLEIENNIHSPIVLGGKLYFVTDREGTANVHYYDFSSKKINRVTGFKDHDVRPMNGFGSTLVFTVAGELYKFDIKDGSTLKIPLKIGSRLISTNYEFNNADESIERIQLFDEENISIISRGRGILKGKYMEAPVTLNPTFKGRIRRIVKLGKDRFAAVQEIEGEDGIIIYKRSGKEEKKAVLDIGIIMNVKAVPDTENVVISNNRHELYMVDLKSGEKTLIDRSPAGRLNDFDISKDSKLVAYSFGLSTGRAQIKIYSIADKKSYEATSGSATDFSPSFDSSGMFLSYLTNRAIDPTYDNLIFDLGFVAIVKPFCIALKKGVKNPFFGIPPQFSKEDLELPYDLDNLKLKSQAFPVEADNYDGLMAGNSQVFYTKSRIEGSTKYYSLGGGPNKKSTLLCYDFTKREEKVVIDGIRSFALSEDRKKILVGKNGDYYIISADSSAESQKEMEKGKVDLKTLSIRKNRREEFKQMYNETWRLMREGYWNSEKLSNWDGIRKKYEKLASMVNTRAELSDVLKKMQGELGTSHSYEIGGDLTNVEYYPSGRLGAVTEDTEKGAIIHKIYCGDPSNEGEKSPLLATGLDVHEGDIIRKIDGVEITLKYGVFEALLNKKEDFINIVVSGKGKKEKEYGVKLLGNHRNLIYRDWVESKRRYVHEKSNGKAGYIHIPDMGPVGFAEFYRLFSEETTYENLVVDVRYNGGGHVSQLILDKLGRKYLGKDMSRFGAPEPYPSYSIKGKMICVTNEFAGSDGDIFSHAFKMMKLGELVGTRTWGGVIGINPMTRLIDGTVVTQPEYAFSFTDVGMGVENYGTDPTIEVEISPEEFASGSDPQLDRALKEIL